MGLLKNILVGGVAGAIHAHHQASNQWSNKNMYELKDDFGVPHFRRRLHDGIGEIMEHQDRLRFDAMGRNYARNAAHGGAMTGALLAAGGTLAASHAGSRRREVRRAPPRMPHPHGGGLGVHGDLAAPAA